MEENENKKPDETEGQKPEDNVTLTPEEEKEGKKNKVAAFFAPKRNKIIVGVSAAALIALIIGLSVGLSKCGSGDGGTITSDSSSGSKVSSDEGSSNSKGNEDSSDSKSEDNSNKITSKAFTSALKLDGDKFTVSIVENKEGGSSTKRIKNGTAIHITQNSGTTSSQEAYYTVEGTGSEAKYYSYDKDSSGTWIKSEDVSKNYVAYSSYDANKEAFDDKLTYAGLTFDETKGGYTTSYTTDDGVSVSGEFYFKNSRLTKAIKTKSGGSETYIFSDTAVDIALPANVHTHSYSTAGKLDLNSANGDYVVSCTCGKTMSRARLDADTYDSVLYGYYPQTRISNEATITSLEALTAESNGWYKLGDAYYAKVAAGDTKRKFKDGTTITSGKEYWYRCDPIEWKVLTSEAGKHTLVSSLLLEAYRYDESSNNYKDSEIRKWINGTFYNTAFSFGDSRIEVTEVDNSDASVDEPSSYVCENTNDKVYLLSYQDCENTSYFADSAARQCQVTDYARASGANFNDDNNCGEYWTRSPSSTGEGYALYVVANGNESAITVSDWGKCVRPVITVKVPVASDHQHKAPNGGSLDLNGDKAMFRGECSSCGNTFTREYASTDKLTSVLYGYYPQTHVSDATTIASLNALTSAESNGWYLLDGTYYAKVAAATPYGDSYSFSDGTTIGNSSYWFKAEAVEWKVVSSSDGQHSLVSSLILDNQVFHSVRAVNTNTYANCDLRTWLTGTFYNAVFSNGGSYLQAYTSGGLNDKVYLNSSGDQCKVSDYAKAIGARLATGTDYGDYWTTALSAYTSYMATIACGDGGYNYRDVNMKYGVRPAITVKIS